VKQHFIWADYQLSGPLTLSLGDYTFHAFGCAGTLEYLTSKFKKIREKNESVRWMLIEFWGRGKSTLMYNFCSEINRKHFFSFEQCPILALYVNRPVRAEDLLDYTYENGLPIPWMPRERIEEVQNARRDLFARALRVIVYAWIKKACCNKDFKNNVKITKKPSLIDLDKIADNTPTETIQYLDKISSKEAYDFLADFLSRFLEYDFACGCLRGEENSIQVMEHIPGLIYPESTPIFLESFSKLLREPRKLLRNFFTFFRLCELVGIHILLVIDEAEDWDYMAKTKLDEFLVEILPTNKISFIIILRTEVENRLRGFKKRFRYFLIRSYMKRLRLHDPNPTDVIEIAKGILATCRTDGSLKLFPFTEEFTLALSNLTVRGGHFNMRMFLRSIDRILKMSLSWQRDDPEIGSDFIKRMDLLESVVDNYRIEDKKELESSVLAKAEEIEKKVKAAREISEHLLSGKVEPPTRYVFNILNELVSEKHQVPNLSDIEIIAYSKKEERAKVTELIRQLK
jgi:hypothetical protein